MIKNILTILLLASATTAQFSSHTYIAPTAFTSGSHPNMVEDFDLSGNLQLVFGGDSIFTPTGYYYVVDSTGAVINSCPNNVTNFTYTTFATDYTGDGINDIITIDRVGSAATIRLWAGTGDGLTSGVSSSSTIPVPSGSLIWALGWHWEPRDYDNDGSLEFLVQGAALLNATPVLHRVYVSGGVVGSTNVGAVVSGGTTFNTTKPAFHKATRYIAMALVSAGPVYSIEIIDPVTPSSIASLSRSVSSKDLEFIDLNSDGWEDLLILDSNGVLDYIIFNTSAFTVASTGSYTIPAFTGITPVAMSLGDFSSPGANELAIVYSDAFSATAPIIATSADLFTTYTTYTPASHPQAGILYVQKIPSVGKTGTHDLRLEYGISGYTQIVHSSSTASQKLSTYGTETIRGYSQGGLPYLNNGHFGMAMKNGVAGKAALCYYGNIQYNPGIVISPYFTLYQNAVSFFGATTVASNGWASAPLPIPNNTALLGSSIYLQWVSLDGSNNVVGSQGVAITIF